MNFIKYNSISKLRLTRNQITLKNVRFSNSVEIIEWYLTVTDNEIIYQKLIIIKDLMLQQRNRLKDFATKFIK